jgi:hypothetical protein
MDINAFSEIKLYDADSFDYAGSILMDTNKWELKDVKITELLELPKDMPLKAMLQMLIVYNLVYDVVGSEEAIKL